MSKGGLSGAVSFPNWLEDIHCMFLSAYTTSGPDAELSTTAWSSWGSTSPWNYSVIELTNAAWTADPYNGMTFSNPTTFLNNALSTYNLFLNSVTGYDEDDFEAQLPHAYAVVTGGSGITDITVTPADAAETDALAFGTSIGAAARSNASTAVGTAFAIAKADVLELIASAATTVSGLATTIGAATTLWDTIITKARTEIDTYNLPKHVDIESAIGTAANDAAQHLRAATEVALEAIADGILTGAVDAFNKRRANADARQLSDYAATMSDINAVNSSAFMFGMALLRSEQLRAGADFEANLALEMYRQGISTYVQTHGAELSAYVQAEIADATNYQRLIEQAVEVMARFSLDKQLRPETLLNLYGEFFRTQIGAFLQVHGVEASIRSDAFRVVKADEVNRAQIELGYKAANKAAKEQRYALGVQQVSAILANKVEFRRALTATNIERNRIGYVMTSEYEGVLRDAAVAEATWDLGVAQQSASLFGVISGTSGVIPKSPSKAGSAIGGALSGAASGALAGSVVPGVGTVAGAAIGTVLGGVGGLLS